MNLFNRMLENDRVAGVKCSSDPAQDVLRFKLAGGKDFIVFNGPDEQFVAGRIMGADAGIGGTYGAMPELYMKMDELIKRGEWDKAAEVQAIVTPLIYRLCSFASMHGAVKGIITLDGCPMGDPRLPFLPVATDDPKLVELYNDIKKEKTGKQVCFPVFYITLNALVLGRIVTGTAWRWRPPDRYARWPQRTWKPRTDT